MFIMNRDIGNILVAQHDTGRRTLKLEWDSFVGFNSQRACYSRQYHQAACQAECACPGEIHHVQSLQEWFDAICLKKVSRVLIGKALAFPDGLCI
jgi:hypothetical protein